MTDQQLPITPPPELVQQWLEEATHRLYTSAEVDEHIAEQAARWGADQELEACCEWLRSKFWIESELVDELRSARRPKPLSLKQQALEQCNDYIDPDGIIRRALEQLDD